MGGKDRLRIKNLKNSCFLLAISSAAHASGERPPPSAGRPARGHFCRRRRVKAPIIVVLASEGREQMDFQWCRNISKVVCTEDSSVSHSCVRCGSRGVPGGSDPASRCRSVLPSGEDPMATLSRQVPLASYFWPQVAPP